MLVESNGVDLTRMQSPDPDSPPAMPPLDVPELPPLDGAPCVWFGAVLPLCQAPAAPASTSGPEGVMPFGGFGGVFAPPVNTVPTRRRAAGLHRAAQRSAVPEQPAGSQPGARSLLARTTT